MAASFRERVAAGTLAPILTGDRSRRQESIGAFASAYDFVRRHLDERRRAGRETTSPRS